jgi:hypothetical protein
MTTDQPYAPNPQVPQPQPKKKHTVRNVLLTVVVLFVLFVGGCMALIGKAANDVANDIEKNDSKAGGSKNPMTIVAGKPFEVDGFKYAKGWTVGKDVLGDLEIKGLKVTNNRKDADSALVEIKFWKGSEVLALADCTTESIAVGTTTKLDCSSTDKLPAQYDKITINDTF